MRRKCKWRENDHLRPKGKDDDWKDGWVLLLTGGMMSAPVAIVEKLGGFVEEVYLENICFVDQVEIGNE